MEKFRQLRAIKELYASGGNIIEYLKRIGNQETNTIEDILISYDLQSGSYIKGLAKHQEYNTRYCKALSEVIARYGKAGSILEVGVGEATTLSTLIQSLESTPPSIFGFDISWSRLKFAKSYLADQGLSNVQLFSANLFEIPLPDNFVDTVYTSHSLEPNGGKEEEALKELFRITKNTLILLEPAYELADENARARMRHHGYVTGLVDTALRLGYDVAEHRLFDHSANPLNPTALIVIRKNAKTTTHPDLICPISHTALVRHNESFLYSIESCLAYPVLDGIPCLLKENSILASHLLTDYQDFKKANRISAGKPS